MTRALVLVALLVATLAPVADAQTTLVVTGYGGRWSEVMKKALVEPFEKKHNVKVEVVTGITTEWVAKLLAAGPENPPYDGGFGNEPPSPTPRSAASSRSETRPPRPTSRTSIPRPSSATRAWPCSGGASASPTAPT